MRLFQRWTLTILLPLPFGLSLIFNRTVQIPQFDLLTIIAIVLAIYILPQFFDIISGEDPGTELNNEKSFNWLVRLLALKSIVFRLIVVYIIATRPITPGVILLGFVTGQVAGASGIVIAHELMHRPSRFDRRLADLLMILVAYPHFCLEHVRGHHVRVATLEDPATARYGETVYAFVARSMYGGLRSAWDIAAEDSARHRKSRWNLRNPVLVGYALVALIYCVIAALAGWAGLIVWIVQCAVAVVTLEVINYTQHYGLLRAKRENGRYEAMRPWHSWNYSPRFTNRYWLNLGRHSDHHLSAYRPYQRLRALKDGPRAPGGLMSMFCLALIPPLWFQVMNPRASAARARPDAVIRPTPFQTIEHARAGLSLLVADMPVLIFVAILAVGRLVVGPWTGLLIFLVTGIFFVSLRQGLARRQIELVSDGDGGTGTVSLRAEETGTQVPA